MRKRRSIRSPEPWLWRIVLNTARDRRRSQQGSALRSAEPPVTTNGYETDAAVRALLAELPERQREAIFLRYYADLDYTAIAEALAVRPGTVGKLLHDARATLRAALGDDDG